MFYGLFLNKIFGFQSIFLCNIITIADINEPHEVYAYFFFKVVVSQIGVKAYKLEKITLDTRMTDDLLTYSISSILYNLLNGDDTIKDRIVVKGNHPLTSYQFEETKKKITKEILDEFHLGKEGMIPNEMMEDLLRRISRNNI